MKIEKLKNELNRRYKLIFDIPEEKIDYNLFVLIADYVDWIEKNKPVKALLYMQKAFQKYSPEFYLIEKGWNITAIVRLYQHRQNDELLLAYMDLIAVWLAVGDMKSELNKEDVLLKNRIKRAKHLKNIRDRKNFIGLGYFWYYKHKYHEWLKTVHQKLLSELAYIDKLPEEKLTMMIDDKKDDGKFQVIDLDNDKNALEKIMNIGKTEKESRKKQEISYKYDKINKTGVLTVGDNKITFEKDRALIVYYFYELSSIDNGYKTYRDFNIKMNRNIASPAFRQGIDKINERIRKEHKFIKSIITQKDKNNINKANRYKWKIET